MIRELEPGRLAGRGHPGDAHAGAGSREPEEIGVIILNHHRTRELFGGAAWTLTPFEEGIRTVIAVLAMVDCICHRLRKGKDSPEWAAIGEKVLAHLKMDQAEFEHLAWDQQDRFAA